MQKKKAISLIVLVITIIVMIVLAGAIILSLSNAGIIGKASNAVYKSDEAQMKTIIQTYWGDAYTEALEQGIQITKEGLEQAIYEKIGENDIDISEYGIAVTTKGVDVVKGWIQDGLTVRRGKQVLNIADDFNYDETAEGTNNVTWKVLGASDKGELLIMSATDIVEKFVLGGETLTTARESWIEFETKLKNECEKYGKGKSATGARCINEDDINKITGVDKTTRAKGELHEYGNEVTYEYNGTSYPKYTSINGLEGKLDEEHPDGFYYYNGTDFEHVKLSEMTGDNKVTIKCTGGGYKAYEKMDQKSKVFNMLFGEYDQDSKQYSSKYFTSSSYVGTSIKMVSYGVMVVYDGMLAHSALWTSNGICRTFEAGIRAVVSLSSDIQVTGSSDTGWSY